MEDNVMAFGLFAECADGGLRARDVGERLEVVQPHGVLVGDLVDLVVGNVVGVEHRVQFLGSPGPHGVRVRVIHLPADVVHTDHVAVLHADRIGDETRHEVLTEHLRGQLAAMDYQFGKQQRLLRY